MSSGPSRRAVLIFGGPACAHHYRSGKVNIVELVPSIKVGAESTAWMVETTGWKVGDAGSRSTNNIMKAEEEMVSGVGASWCDTMTESGAYFGRLGIQASRHFSAECN